MSEQIYTYRNNTFYVTQANNYTLLLQLDATSFAFAIINDAKQLLAYNNNCGLNELTNPQLLGEVLTAQYKNTIIGLPAKGFTLIPASLFMAEKVADFARLLDVQPNEKVLSQQLDNDNYIIYKADEKIVAAAQKFNISNAVYVNSGWIKAIAQSNPSNNDLYININNVNADYLYFKDGKLRFYNSFECDGADDLVYYTAFVAQELNLDAQAVNLVLSGDKTGNGLTDFYPSVSFNNLQVIELPEQIASHQILTLAALSLCGSSEAY